jgi:hypothetical protein
MPSKSLMHGHATGVSALDANLQLAVLFHEIDYVLPAGT